jgi:hypothetical protein
MKVIIAGGRDYTPTRDACILFPGGRGTADMKQKALAKGLRVIEYKEQTR